MPENVNNCLLCGSDQSVVFDQRKFRGQEVVNRVCKTCGLVYQSPRMTEEEAAVFYQAEYRRLYQGQEGPIARDFATQTARAESLLDFIQPRVTSITSHLDIGCSTGLILQHFKNKFGCRPVGIEPGEAYRSYARTQGLTVYASLEELETKGQDRFSLISMSHVLEHLPDPVGSLVHLRNTLLELEGRLLLEVPNLYAHDSFEVAHLVSFSSHSLAQTLEKAGYEIDRQEQHGRPRSQLLPLYITVLAHPTTLPPKSPRPEKRVALKRKVGMFRRHILERLVPNLAWLGE